MVLPLLYLAYYPYYCRSLRTIHRPITMLAHILNALELIPIVKDVPTVADKSFEEVTNVITAEDKLVMVLEQPQVQRQVNVQHEPL